MFPHQPSSQVYFRPEHAPRNHLQISGRSRQEDEHTGAAVPAVTSPSALALVSSAGSISGDTPLRSSYRSETLSDQKPAIHKMATASFSGMWTLLLRGISAVLNTCQAMLLLSQARSSHLLGTLQKRQVRNTPCRLKSNLQPERQERRRGAPEFASCRRNRPHVRP